MDYIKVKRGMVFLYNIDPDVDKKGIREVTIGNRTIKDHLQYGERTYVVVSNDLNNLHSPTCNIVPMTGQTDKSDIPTHVNITYQGRPLTILCEHIYTVNTAELFKYSYTLTDEVMKKVDKALATQIGLTPTNFDINSIEEPRVSDSFKPSCTYNPKPIEEPKKAKSQIDKFNERLGKADPKYSKVPIPEPKPVKVTVRTDDSPATSKKTRRKWTEESAREFLADSDKMSPTEMVKKYSLIDINEYYKIRYYLQHKLK